MEKAEVWVALTDGGAGLEDFMQDNFNRTDLVLILDFYHAASYLEKLAKALHPQDEQAAMLAKISSIGEDLSKDKPDLNAAVKLVFDSAKRNK